MLSARSNSKGFTLNELLIVMAIIGILSAIAVPAYMGQREKARQMVLKASARAVETELSVVLNDFAIGAPFTLLSSVGTRICYESATANPMNLCALNYSDVPVADTYTNTEDVLKYYVNHNDAGLGLSSPYDGAPLLTDKDMSEMKNGHVLVSHSSDEIVHISAWTDTGSMIWNAPIMMRKYH